MRCDGRRNRLEILVRRWRIAVRVGRFNRVFGFELASRIQATNKTEKEVEWQRTDGNFQSVDKTVVNLERRQIVLQGVVDVFW